MLVNSEMIIISFNNGYINEERSDLMSDQK